MKVAVAGATGLVGRHVMRELAERGHAAVPLTRSTGVDLRDGAGLEARLGGVDAVIDVTNMTTSSAAWSIAFFGAVSRSLLAAEVRAGVRHHLALSIVGIDRVDIGYYHGKLRQEELITASRLPWTILRATQFHEFAGQLLERSSFGPVAVVPRMRTQPIAARAVAEALADLGLGRPVGRAADLAGPRVEEVPTMARQLMRARRSRRRVIAVRLPGSGGRTMASGGLLPQGNEYSRASRTFMEWLRSEDAREWL